MSQLKTNSITNIGNTGDANIELYADGSTSIRNLQNLAPNLAVNGAMTVAQRGVGPSLMLATRLQTGLLELYDPPEQLFSGSFDR